MTSEQFQTQVNRLCETYGKNHYGTERARLIWNEVRDFSNEWFARIVSELISKERLAPLIDKFREAIAAERDRLWKLNKIDNAETAKNWTEVFTGEDKKMLCDGIVKRMTGRMTDQEFQCLLKMIENASTKKTG